MKYEHLDLIERAKMFAHPSCTLDPNMNVLLKLDMARSTEMASPICTIAHPSLDFKNFTYKKISEWSSQHIINNTAG